MEPMSLLRWPIQCDGDSRGGGEGHHLSSVDLRGHAYFFRKYGAPISRAFSYWRYVIRNCKMGAGSHLKNGTSTRGCIDYSCAHSARARNPQSPSSALHHDCYAWMRLHYIAGRPLGTDVAVILRDSCHVHSVRRCARFVARTSIHLMLGAACSRQRRLIA
jgi:hypothetical protein